MGILAALIDARVSGKGQVVDSAMCDGAVSLMTAIYEKTSLGEWTDAREANIFDGGAPFYRTFECDDGGYVSIGALEPKFYGLLCESMARAEAGHICVDPVSGITQATTHDCPACRKERDVELRSRFGTSRALEVAAANEVAQDVEVHEEPPPIERSSAFLHELHRVGASFRRRCVAQELSKTLEKVRAFRR